MLINEKKILLLIRYAPLVFLLLVSIPIDIFLLEQKKIVFKNEKKEIEKNYIQINKEISKQEILELTHYIKTRQIDVEKDLKLKLKEGVLNTHRIIKAIYDEHQDESQEEAKKRISKIFSVVRFNQDRSYIFIFEKNGKNILNPFKDEKENYFFKDFQRLLNNKNQIYFSWYGKKKDNKLYKKIAFVKELKELGIYIGAADFVSEYENNLKKEILFYIKNIRLKDNKYVFVIDFKGKYLNHFDDIYIGQNIKHTNLIPNNETFFSQIKKTAFEGGGFVKYPYVKPSTNQVLQKTSYVSIFDKWKWILGTGFYMDDFKKEVELKKKQLDEEHQLQKNRLFIIMISFTFVLTILSILISKILEKKFLTYKNKIEKQLEENIKKDNMIAYQSKMASMGEMIGNIAHQWRQPLSIISSAATGIKFQREIGILTDELEKEELDLINNNVKYLSKTIDDFRNFLKPNKKMTLFKVDELISKTLKLVSAQYENKNIIIKKNIENISIVSFENELLQVLINILNNARDELLKYDKKRFIFIYAKEENKKLIIEIKDNANGIKSELLDKIFEPYFSTKDEDKGTGIGLFMSKEIVEKHLGGVIEVSTVEYKYKDETFKGASFKVIIPLENKNFK